MTVLMLGELPSSCPDTIHFLRKTKTFSALFKKIFDSVSSFVLKTFIVRWVKCVKGLFWFI